MARSDGTLGPHLRHTETDCETAGQPALLGVAASSSEGVPRCGFFGFSPGTDFRASQGGLAFRGLTLTALAKALAPILHRSVSDRTGLAGYFDGDFDFVAELPLPPPPPGESPLPDTSYGSIFSVLPARLGPTLKPQQGPVEVLVIDGAELPIDN